MHDKDPPRLRVGKFPEIPYEGLRGEKNAYVAPRHLVHAANTALALGMPLLLTGEPGCGKSDFAWAVAHALDPAGAPRTCYVRSDTRARDLLYQFDAVARFGDAHGDPNRARDPRHYVRLEPLGQALAWPFEVLATDSQGTITRYRPTVVLIDEIDKAPRDLPNDLLQELDRKRFEIAEIPAGITGEGHGEVLDDDPQRFVPFRRKMDRFMSLGADARALRAEIPSPFVIITSNAERHLPEPFLRRCVFFQIPPPDEDALIKIAEAHFPGRPKLMQLLPRIVHALRSRNDLVKKPSAAEMLRWMEVALDTYEPADLEVALRPFAAALLPKQTGKSDERPPPPMGLPWRDLPGLGCLIKTREDWEKLHLRALA